MHLFCFTRATLATDGQPYSTTAYSAFINASYVKRGLVIKVLYNTDGVTTWSNLIVGAPTRFDIVTVPLYFFGADPATAVHKGKKLTPDLVGSMPSDDIAYEYMTKLPIASFKLRHHPAKYFKTPYMIVSPRSGGPAYRLLHKEDAKDGFAPLSVGMNIIGTFRSMDGEEDMATQYYGAMVMNDKSGQYTGPGGGLGGGHIGTGDYSYGGIFYHEQGHAFGLPHANDAFKANKYPYPNGGLKGSGWGYDERLNMFVDPFDNKCRADKTDNPQPREDAEPRRCYKQDPMQSGHGHQEAGSYYSISSDFQNARIQRYFEGTTLDQGRMWKNVTSSGGYVKWNPATQNFTDVAPNPTKVAQVFNTKLVAVIFTVSCPEIKCNSSGILDTDALTSTAVTQIYPPVEYTGNAKEFVDVDDVKQLDRHHWPKAKADGRAEKRTCDNGCDFIAAFTFKDGSVKRIMIPKSFRAWQKPTDPVHVDSPDPLKGQSYKVLGVAVPGSGVRRVDLMYAPRVWEGIHARVPQLITSWTKENGETQPPKGINARVASSPSSAHTIIYDVKMSVPTTANHCEMERDLDFVRAMEKAVFNVIGGGDGGKKTKTTLPPLSRVKVKCICTGATCDDGCARSFSYPQPVISTSAAASTPAPAPAPATAPAPWKPDCGCTFKNFDGNATCSGGSTHQSQLTRVQHSPGVYYFTNAEGEGMMVKESMDINGWPWVYSKDLDGMLARCRATGDCGVTRFEINHATNKTQLMQNRCLSPCYVKDYWNRVDYHVDSTNEWVKDQDTRDKEERALTFRFEVFVPADAAAATVHAKLSSSTEAATAVGKLLAADELFTKSVPWGFTSDGIVPGKLSAASFMSPPPPSSSSPPLKPTKKPSAPPPGKKPPEERKAPPPPKVDTTKMSPDDIKSELDKTKKLREEADKRKQLAKEKAEAAKKKATEAREKATLAKAKAQKTRDAIVAKLAAKNQKHAKLAEIAANAAIAGMKLKKLKASVNAVNETVACDKALSSAGVSADDVACVVNNTAAGGRRLLLEAGGVFNVEILVNPDTVDASAAADNLQASGVTVTVVEEDPATVLATVISGDDLTALTADTKEAAQAETTAATAETASTAAANELKTAEDEVATIASKVETLTTAASAPSPPPYTTDASGSSKIARYHLFRTIVATVACAAVTQFLV